MKKDSQFNEKRDSTRVLRRPAVELDCHCRIVIVELCRLKIGDHIIIKNKSKSQTKTTWGKLKLRSDLASWIAMSVVLAKRGNGLLPVVNLTSTDIARGDESEPAQQGCPSWRRHNDRSGMIFFCDPSPKGSFGRQERKLTVVANRKFCGVCRQKWRASSVFCSLPINTESVWKINKACLSFKNYFLLQPKKHENIARHYFW